MIWVHAGRANSSSSPWYSPPLLISVASVTRRSQYAKTVFSIECNASFLTLQHARVDWHEASMHHRNYIREAEAMLFHRLGYLPNPPRAHNLDLWSLTLWGSSWYTISPHGRSAHCPIKRSFNLYGKTKYQSSPLHIHFFYAWSSPFPPCICITKRLTLNIFHTDINSMKSPCAFQPRRLPKFHRRIAMRYTHVLLLDLSLNLALCMIAKVCSTIPPAPWLTGWFTCEVCEQLSSPPGVTCFPVFWSQSLIANLFKEVPTAKIYV